MNHVFFNSEQELCTKLFTPLRFTESVAIAIRCSNVHAIKLLSMKNPRQKVTVFATIGTRPNIPRKGLK